MLSESQSALQLKQNIHGTTTHNYTNQQHTTTSIQNIQKLTSSYKIWQKHIHTKSHTHTWLRRHGARAGGFKD